MAGPAAGPDCLSITAACVTTQQVFARRPPKIDSHSAVIAPRCCQILFNRPVAPPAYYIQFPNATCAGEVSRRAARVRRGEGQRCRTGDVTDDALGQTASTALRAATSQDSRCSQLIAKAKHSRYLERKDRIGSIHFRFAQAVLASLADLLFIAVPFALGPTDNVRYTSCCGNGMVPCTVSGLPDRTCHSEICHTDLS